MVLSEGSPKARSEASSPKVKSEASSPKAKSEASSPKAKSEASSPKAKSEGSPKANNPANSNTDIDFSMMSWIRNTHSVLHSPLGILSVVGLVVIGSFVEIAPRKSLEFLDNALGRAVFFILPFIIAVLIDWPTGLLAATVSLIIFARLQKHDSSEGYSDLTEDSNNSTTLISSPHRWFIERILGESPIAISSDKVITTNPKNNDIRSSSSSMDKNSSPFDSSSSVQGNSTSFDSSSSNK